MKRQDLLKALTAVRPTLANKELVEQATSFAFMDGRVVAGDLSWDTKHGFIEVTGC